MPVGPIVYYCFISSNQANLKNMCSKKKATKGCLSIFQELVVLFLINKGLYLRTNITVSYSRRQQECVYSSEVLGSCKTQRIFIGFFSRVLIFIFLLSVTARQLNKPNVCILIGVGYKQRSSFSYLHIASLARSYI